MIDFSVISQHKSLNDALIAFRDAIRPLGVRDIFYGYMLEPRGFIRHDVCVAVTFPENLMSLYENGGGIANDPVAKNLPATKDYFLNDFRTLSLENTGIPLAQRKFINGLLEADYSTAWSFPMHDVEPTGYGAMTIYQDVKGTPRLDPEGLKPLVQEFHMTAKRTGLLAYNFGLTESEIWTLRLTAAGKTAEDIANSNSISARSIELRLGNARAKLRARSTAEAVFKATCYGILNDRM